MALPTPEEAAAANAARIKAATRKDVRSPPSLLVRPRRPGEQFLQVVGCAATRAVELLPGWMLGSGLPLHSGSLRLPHLLSTRPQWLLPSRGCFGSTPRAERRCCCCCCPLRAALEADHARKLAQLREMGLGLELG